MDFWIQASSPKHTGGHDPDDSSIGEAVETAFPLHTECALMVFHHLCVALSYKYDMSVMMADVVSLLSGILDSESGERTVQWPSNTFCARWSLQWKSDALCIDADWLSVVGVPEQALNAAGKVTMSTRQFVSEWKELLARVLGALDACGYRASEIEGLGELQELYRRIQGAGILYA